MNRAPYVLARACTRADEVYFHRAHLVHRLRVLLRGCRPSLQRVHLGRAALPNGSGVRVSIAFEAGAEQIGYVLRQGVDASDLLDLLYADLVDGQEREAA